MKRRSWEAWCRDGIVAFVLALVAHPIAEFAFEHVGVTIHVPALVPAAVVVLAALLLVRRKDR